MDEFYVGYFPKAPRLLARLVRGTAIALVVGGVAIAALLVYTQAPFAASKFEFGVNRDYEGTLVAQPYPMLLTRDAQFLLVAPGKHGFAAGELPGQAVRLRGSLIERDANAMLEVESVKALGIGAGSPVRVDLGRAALVGEIVDSKCYLGVMNPGSTKVHRDCAARCISGGIPPAFVARDAAGVSRTFLLTGANRTEILDFVAEPVEISGRVERIGTMLILNSEGIKRTARRIP